MADEVKLPENVERLLLPLEDGGHDLRRLRRAIAAALLRAEADGCEQDSIHADGYRAQADALEKP